MLADDTLERIGKGSLVFHTKGSIFTIRHIGHIAARIDQRLCSAEERLSLLHASETGITDAQAHNLSARSHPIRGRVLGLGTYNASDMRAVCARQCHNRKYVTIAHNIDRERQKVHFAKIRPLSLQSIVCHAWFGAQVNYIVAIRGRLALRGIHDIPLSATDHSAPVHTVMKYHGLKHRSRVFPVLGKVFQHSYSSLEIFMVLCSGVFIARLLGTFARIV